MLPPHEPLPRFIPPMLSVPHEAFDSPDYLFEIKWDGTRSLVFIEDGEYRLVNRRRIDMTDRYPEFAFMARLPAGTVLDGEVVVLQGGRPHFPLLESREQARSPLKIRTKARATPATYIVFDLLYAGFMSWMTRPLVERRLLLDALVREANNPLLVFSDAVVGQGKAFFEQACREDLEGVIAKRMNSPYLPGKRTDAWYKIKRQAQLICAIIGFLPSGKDDFRSLILATDDDGKLSCCGKVGTGFDGAMRRQLNELLWSNLRPKPIVPCKIKGKWLEPGLFCRVSFMERTSGGDLRAPAFKELIVRK